MVPMVKTLSIRAIACLVLLISANSAFAETAPETLAPAQTLVRNGQAHQKAGRTYEALHTYLQAEQKLGKLKTEDIQVQKAAQDLINTIETYIDQIKDEVQKKGLVNYRGKFYTFEGLQKQLKKEADRKKRFEKYLREEAQQRQLRQEQRRAFEEQRLRRDFQAQQEQRRQNEERRREYERRQRQR